ncbi:hypothetical protein [Burkholderia pseudomallei]|uniref:hypothetical protein n=1 Tax=Burkholderia pseudomallei TaxID=28450 RepID=UPI001594E0F1|nr:hypothetical protein [Burkholderia pseudomallei]MBF3650519.1 hypothetical protein [Burkholderia pseudomallei]MCV9985187.1 hypothetical protein [Burkholderia pseudomallei]MCV9991531.1 hypothetical protein [Burkholderia pseudomallei]MCW0032016.1 hypothetical protein [Burkholderia pseudomallei]MCW0088662.1 hypothetical protein [Burkholderia pseudomallei]
MILATGWAWEYIDELDLPRVEALYRGFKKHPPMHWCAAAFVKFKPQAGAATASSDGGAKPSEMFASMGGRLLDE